MAGCYGSTENWEAEKIDGLWTSASKKRMEGVQSSVSPVPHTTCVPRC
jgi:hypothetical protein